MNLLRLLPGSIRRGYENNIKNSGVKVEPGRYFLSIFLVSFAVSILLAFILLSLSINFLLSFIGIFIIFNVVIYFRVSLKATGRLKRMEDDFPDFIQLMSSNLRAGMTVDRSFLLSARPEFVPLNNEIMKTGREIATGKDTGRALIDMANRINSDKIRKTIMLITSGLKSGGNMSQLLEETASSMREREFVEKKAAANVLMYVIFIFFAISVGAPVLFGLSSILVQIIIEVVGSLPVAETVQLNIPVAFGQIDISVEFIIYFSLIFMIAMNIVSSLLIGLINKGDEKAGLKYILPLLALSITIFFIIRLVLYRYISGSFGIVG